MNEPDPAHETVHWSFSVIAILGLLWYMMGVANFIGQMDPAVVDALPESHQAIVEGRPVWATVAFGIGVFGGAIGCCLLLLRRGLAVPVLIASLVGVVLQLIPHVGMIGSAITGPGEIVAMIVLPVVFAALFLWYARRVAARGWIG